MNIALLLASLVVFIGDDLPYTFDKSWGAQNVWERNWQAAPYNATNLAVNVQYSETLLTTINGGLLDGLDPDVIVVQTGHTNFKQRGDAVDKVVGYVSDVVTALKAKKPSAKIVLSAIVPNYGTGDTSYLGKVAEANPELAKLADGSTVLWCGYDHAFHRDNGGYLRWTGALTKSVNAALRGGVAPTPGATTVVTPTFAKTVAADIVIEAMDYITAQTALGNRVVLPATESAIVNQELAKLSDGHDVIYCGDATQLPAIQTEAAATDRLPIGPVYAEDDYETVVIGEVAATRPVTRICEKSWRGTNWWGDRLKRNRAAILASGGAVDFVFAGDSITHFWEDYGPNNYKALTNVYSIVNCGYGGDATENLLWRFQNGELDGYAAKAVMMMIGTNNNGVNDYNPTNTFAGVRACVNLVKAKQPAAKILLMSYLPRAVNTSDGSCTNNAADIRNRETAKLLKAEYADDAAVEIIDLYSSFLGSDGKIPVTLMSDYIHPTELGYSIWRGAVQPTFVALTGREPGHVTGEYLWQAVSGVYDGTFLNAAHWSNGGINEVPGLDDRAYIGCGLDRDFTVTFPKGAYTNYARLCTTAKKDHAVTLDLRNTTLYHPENTQSTYNSYNQFNFFYNDSVTDVLSLNLYNASPDPTTAPHLEVGGTEITASSPGEKKIDLAFDGGLLNVNSVLGHTWTTLERPRLYLFAFNNNQSVWEDARMNAASVTFRNGASLKAANLCVQGNAATNVLTFSGGKHEVNYINLPGNYDGAAIATDRTVTDIIFENGADFTCSNRLGFTWQRATNRVYRLFVKSGATLRFNQISGQFGTFALDADGGTVEFTGGNQDFSYKTLKDMAISVRNGGTLLVNQTEEGGVAAYLGQAGGEPGHGRATLSVDDATLRVLAPRGKVAFRKGVGSFTNGALFENGGYVNFKGNEDEALPLLFSDMTITNTASVDFGNGGQVDVAMTNVTLRLAGNFACDDATFDVVGADFSLGAKWYLGSTTGKTTTVNFRSGSVTTDSATANTFEIGWYGTGRLNQFGGTLTLGTLRLGALYADGTDKALENVLDIEGGELNIRCTSNGDGLCAGYNANRANRIILNGGVLKVYRIYKTAGTSHLEANGGTLKAITACGGWIRNLDSATVGPKGLTVDNAGFATDFTQAFADKADANGEGRIILKGAGSTAFKGSIAGVSHLVADEGTVDLSQLPDAAMGALVATNAVTVKLDPTKTLALSGTPVFANVAFAFSSDLALGESYDLFTYKTALSAASREALYDPAVTAGLPSGAVAEFAEVETDAGYALRLIVRSPVNTLIDVRGGVSNVTESIRYRTGDAYTAEVAAGATLNLSGPIGKGAFYKTGLGSLFLSGVNDFLGGFRLDDGRLVVTDPTALGGTASLKNGVLELTEPQTFAEPFSLVQESTNDIVIVKNEADVTMPCPIGQDKTGEFVKRGAGRLTWAVPAGTTRQIAGGSGWRTRINNNMWSWAIESLPQWTYDAENGTITTNNVPTFAVAEGELLIVGAGDGATVRVGGYAAVGLSTKVGAAQPGLVLDNVTFDETTSTYPSHNKFLLATAINYSYGANARSGDFVTSPYVILTNGAHYVGSEFEIGRFCEGATLSPRFEMDGATFEVTRFCAMRSQGSEVKPIVSVRNGSKMYVRYLEYCQRDELTFDNSVLAKNAQLDPISVRYDQGGSPGTWQRIQLNLLNGSTLHCNSIALPTEKMNVDPVTFRFADSSWVPSADDFTFAWDAYTNFVIMADAGGLKLPVPSGKTWTMNHPVAGAGDLIQTGAGTLALGSRFEKAEGAVVAASGTVDLGGGSLAVTIAGAGSFANGTVAEGGIRLDPAKPAEIPTVAATVSFSGRTTVDLGYGDEPAPTGSAVTVLKYEGAAPDVSTWKLSDRRFRGNFAVDAGAKTVTATPEMRGVMLILE